MTPERAKLQGEGGAHPSDRATRPTDQAPAGLGDTASVPCAFTPGPWEVRRYGGDKLCNVRGPNDHPVAQIAWMPETGNARMSADAHLIAAAPELYKAAVEAFDFLGGVDDASPVRDTLLKALRKALGQ